MSEVPTYTAALYVGLRVGYTDREHTRFAAEKVIRDYVDEVGLCVAVNDTTFFYSRRPETPHGRESGLAIGFINYPRFPSDLETIRRHAEELGRRLKESLGQNRVTVVYPDVTRMVGEVA